MSFPRLIDATLHGISSVLKTRGQISDAELSVDESAVEMETVKPHNILLIVRNTLSDKTLLNPQTFYFIFSK